MACVVLGGGCAQRTLVLYSEHIRALIGCAAAGITVMGGAVANHLRVMLETGPKGKKVVAVAPDWPGLARGATTEQAAIERLLAYVPRYVPVTKLAAAPGRCAT